MSELEKYLELAKLIQEDFAARRDLEWKLSIGLWGGAAALTYAITQEAEIHQKVALYCDKSYGLIQMIFWAVLIAHGAILILIQNAHARNRRLFWWYLEKAEGLTSTERPYKTLNSYKDWYDGIKDIRRWLWFTYHMSMTAIVLLAVWFMLQLNSVPK